VTDVFLDCRTLSTAASTVTTCLRETGMWHLVGMDARRVGTSEIELLS
jgi:hypothetical protein